MLTEGLGSLLTVRLQLEDDVGRREALNDAAGDTVFVTVLNSGGDAEPVVVKVGVMLLSALGLCEVLVVTVREVDPDSVREALAESVALNLTEWLQVGVNEAVGGCTALPLALAVSAALPVAVGDADRD